MGVQYLQRLSERAVDAGFRTVISFYLAEAKYVDLVDFKFLFVGFNL
jgi:hypothetical protein